LSSRPAIRVLSQAAAKYCPAFAGMTDCCGAKNPTSPSPWRWHEIEVELVGLQDGIFARALAAAGPNPARRGLKRRAALSELGGVDQKFDGFAWRTSPDHVAVFTAQRAADRGSGVIVSMQHDGAERGAAIAHSEKSPPS